MSESPLYTALKKEGKTSINPLKESFGHKTNFKMVLLALFGAVMGQGVIWYTGQFYAQSFLENAVKLEFMQNREILLWAIGLATPFFLFFGWLSDKIGRKWIMLTGMLLGVIFYRPIFGALLKDANAKEWMQDKKNISDGAYNEGFKSDTIINLEGIKIINHKENIWQYKGTKFTEKRNDTLVMTEGGFTLYPPLSSLGPNDGINFDSLKFAVKPDLKPVYLDKILSTPLKWKFIFLVWVMIVFVTMAYGPIAAFLVELFPTKIRYTSMSLPYHIGNGVFGGLVPFIATLLATTFTTDPLVGLWYPIGVAALCFIIGALYLTNKKDKEVND
jgi:MFS family permease